MVENIYGKGSLNHYFRKSQPECCETQSNNIVYMSDIQKCQDYIHFIQLRHCFEALFFISLALQAFR